MREEYISEFWNSMRIIRKFHFFYNLKYYIEQQVSEFCLRDENNNAVNHIENGR